MLKSKTEWFMEIQMYCEKEHMFQFLKPIEIPEISVNPAYWGYQT
jgi:hypothetical protein